MPALASWPNISRLEFKNLAFAAMDINRSSSRRDYLPLNNRAHNARKGRRTVNPRKQRPRSRRCEEPFIVFISIVTLMSNQPGNAEPLPNQRRKAMSLPKEINKENIVFLASGGDSDMEDAADRKRPAVVRSRIIRGWWRRAFGGRFVLHHASDCAGLVNAGL
jgi:hypothetical protein